jgi:hypothetical protein
MAHVVESEGLGKTGTFQQWLKGPSVDVVTAQRRTLVARSEWSILSTAYPLEKSAAGFADAGKPSS